MNPPQPSGDAEMGLPLEEGEGDTPNLEGVSVEHHDSKEVVPSEETPEVPETPEVVSETELAEVASSEEAVPEKEMATPEEEDKNS